MEYVDLTEGIGFNETNAMARASQGCTRTVQLGLDTDAWQELGTG